MQNPDRKDRSSRTGAVTMATVGRLAGVSQVTVSRALSDPAKVSPEAMVKIREAIEITGYVPNAIAGALASRRTRLITALVPSITNIVYSSLLHGFSDIMRGEGYQIMLSETGFNAGDEEAAIAAHLSRRPDGLLLTGIHHSVPARRMLMAAAIPVVEIWDMTETPIDCCVGFSHADTGRLAADFAISAGYRHAATLSAGDERAERRRFAFADRFATATGNTVTAIGLPIRTATLEMGRQGVARLVDEGLLRNRLESTVIHCSSDVIAHGALIEARTRGLRVPEDLAIIGFGDQDFAAHTDPSLTTIRIDRDQLGRAAAEALLSRFAGDTSATSIRLVGFELMRRGSA